MMNHLSKGSNPKKVDVDLATLQQRITTGVPMKVKKANKRPKKFKVGEGVGFIPDLTDAHAGT